MAVITHLLAFCGGVIFGWFVLALICAKEPDDEYDDERGTDDE